MNHRPQTGHSIQVTNALVLNSESYLRQGIELETHSDPMVKLPQPNVIFSDSCYRVKAATHTEQIAVRL